MVLEESEETGRLKRVPYGGIRKRWRDDRSRFMVRIFGLRHRDRDVGGITGGKDGRLGAGKEERRREERREQRKEAVRK